MRSFISLACRFLTQIDNECIPNDSLIAGCHTLIAVSPTTNSIGMPKNVSIAAYADADASLIRLKPIRTHSNRAEQIRSNE